MIFQIALGSSSCAHLEIIVTAITQLYNKIRHFLGVGGVTGQQTSFVKCPIGGILGLAGHTVLLQLLGSAVVS